VPNQFRTRLEIVRQIISSNQLISGHQTNTILGYYSFSNQEYSLYTYTFAYPMTNTPLCGCTNDIGCRTSSNIYDLFGTPTKIDEINNADVLMTLPGLSVGCMPVHSLLLYTLECLYNQTCLKKNFSRFSSRLKDLQWWQDRKKVYSNPIRLYN